MWWDLPAPRAVLSVLHPLLVLLWSAQWRRVGGPPYVQLDCHASGLARLTLERRLEMSSDLLVARESATEIRACTAQEALLAEHGRLAAETEREETTLSRAQTSLTIAGQALGGLGTAATYLVLWLFLFGGVMPLATAGIAIIAIKTGHAALDRTVTAVDNSFLYGLYVEEYHQFLQQAATRSYLHPQVAPENFQEIQGHDLSFACPGNTEANSQAS